MRSEPDYADLERLRMIMVAVATEDGSKLADLVDEGLGDVRELWNYIATLTHRPEAAKSMSELIYETYASEEGDGFCIDAEFPSALGRHSRIFLMLDFFTDAPRARVVFRGVSGP